MLRESGAGHVKVFGGRDTKYDMDEPHADGADTPFVAERLSGEKVARQVARAIVVDIVGQGLGEGASLPSEPVMLEKYRVGRPTLREALRILEVNGIITIRPGRSGGPRVRRSDTRDLARLLSLHFASRRVTYAEVTSARLVIEPTLAGLAAANATDSERQGLAELLHSSAKSSSSGWLADSRAFHRSVAIISHDRVVGPLSVALQLILDPVRAESARSWATLMAEHVPIGEAIIRGAAAEAKSLMADHMLHYPPPTGAARQIVDWA